MKRTRRLKTKDIFEIPSDESADLPARSTKRLKRPPEPKRRVLASKDTNITHRPKPKAVVNVTPRKTQAASTKSKIPVRVKPLRTQTPTQDIRSYFKPHTPLLDQLSDCSSDDQNGDYWKHAKAKKALAAQKQARPGTPAVQRERHGSPSPESLSWTPTTDSPTTQNIQNAGTTPRYRKVAAVPRAGISKQLAANFVNLRSKQASFGAGITYLPEVIPEYDWTENEFSEDSDLDLDFSECITSTPTRAFRRYESSIDNVSCYSIH